MLGGKLSQNVHHNQHLSPKTKLPKEYLLDLTALLIFPLFPNMLCQSRIFQMANSLGHSIKLQHGGNDEIQNTPHFPPLRYFCSNLNYKESHITSPPRFIVPGNISRVLGL